MAFEITYVLTNIIVDVKINGAFSLSLGIFFISISVTPTEKEKTNYIFK